jgi:hypothetical protein
MTKISGLREWFVTIGRLRLIIQWRAAGKDTVLAKW